MAGYRVRLLGPPALTHAASPVHITSGKGRALLWYLAAHRGKALPRAHLAGLLWPDRPESFGRRSLSTLLHRLRAELPLWPVRAGEDALAWDTETGGAVDAAEFLARAGLTGNRRCTATGAMADLRVAAALWQGPFLHGLTGPSPEYEEWLAQERRTWEARIIAVLSALVVAEAERGHWDQVALHAEQALEIDGLQESFHRHLMLAHYHQGNRSAALVQYEACRRVLTESLAVEPDRATTALRDAIVRGTVAPGVHFPGHALAPQGAGAPPPVPSGARPAAPVGLPSTPPATTALRPTAAPPLGAPAIPLVGREPEWEQLTKGLARTRPGAGQMVLLHGEAGIGKSRLVEEYRRQHQSGRVQPHWATVLMGRSHETSQGLTLAPVAEALVGVVTPERLGKGIWPDGVLLEVSRLLPDISAHRPDLLPRSEGTTPEGAVRLFQGVGYLLAALPQPLLLVLEDLHWADGQTLQLVAHLLRYPGPPGPLQLGVLATARQEDLPPDLHRLLRALEREQRLTWVTLPRLTRGQTEDLMRHAHPAQRQALTPRVYELTDGNPLFALELARYMVEIGIAHPGGTKAGGGVPTPPTVRRVIEHRLALLPEAARELAAAAGVFPFAVSYRPLQQVADLPEGEALAAVEALLAAGLFRESAEGKLDFSHPLMREVVKASLSAPRQVVLHGRAYHALMESTGDRPSLLLQEALARHARGAELWGPAAHWSLMAADAAEHLSAYEKATFHLRCALDALSRLPWSEARRYQMLGARLKMARIRYWLEGRGQQRWLAASEEEARALGDESKLLEVQVLRAQTLYMAGRAREAQAILEALLPRVRAAGSPALLGLVYAGLGFCQILQGDYAAARTTYEQAGTELAPVARAMAPESPQVGLRALMGDFAGAGAALSAARGRARGQEDPAQMGYLLATEAMVAYLRQDWPAAVALGRAGLERGLAAEHRFHAYYASVWVGLGLTAQGKTELAIPALKESVRLARRAHTRQLLDWVLAGLAAAWAQTGQFQRAERFARAGLRLARRYGYRHGAALCVQALGQVAAAGGDRPRARRYLGEALGELQAIGAWPHVAIAHLALAAVVESPEAAAVHRRQAQELAGRMGIPVFVAG